jgi:transposase
MLRTGQINEIHRLAGGEHWSMRRIARQLHMDTRTVKKYLHSPVLAPVHRPRPSKLDPFKPLLAELLERDPRAPGVVVLQRLPRLSQAGASVRFHSARPRAHGTGGGELFEIDWGHFGALDYQGDKRRLHAFALIEAHSRILYVEFTHFQCFETFVRCHQPAFETMGGV